jgi:hypothetical protein
MVSEAFTDFLRKATKEREAAEFTKVFGESIDIQFIQIREKTSLDHFHLIRFRNG